MARRTLTQEEVRRLFDYREGKLFWKFRHSQRIAPGTEVGSINRRNGYRYATVHRTTQRVHRLVFLWHHGWIPDAIDHINRDKLDNRIENLRPSTPAENAWNIGHRGAFRERGKWRSRIMANGKRHEVGTFDSEEQALAAYQEAKQRLHVHDTR